MALGQLSLRLAVVELLVAELEELGPWLVVELVEVQQLDRMDTADAVHMAGLVQCKVD